MRFSYEFNIRQQNDNSTSVPVRVLSPGHHAKRQISVFIFQVLLKGFKQLEMPRVMGETQVA